MKTKLQFHIGNKFKGSIVSIMQKSRDHHKVDFEEIKRKNEEVLRKEKLRIYRLKT